MTSLDDDMEDHTDLFLDIGNTTEMATAIGKEMLLPIDMRFNDGHRLSIIVYR